MTALVLTALLASPGPCPIADAKTGVAILPLALAADGLALEAERLVLPPRWSVAVGANYRDVAGGTYSGYSLGLNGELRYWLLDHGIGTCADVAVMAGPYAAAHLDLGRTHLRGAGTATTWSVVGFVGWRFTVSRATITPRLGIGSTADSGGRLARGRIAAIRMGMTLGWLFD